MINPDDESDTTEPLLADKLEEAPLTIKQAIADMSPMLLTCTFMLLFEISTEAINLWIVGQMDDTVALAGVGLGFMITWMFLMSTVFGLNSALETLVAQAYGAGRLQLCGHYLTRQYFIILLWLVPLFVGLTFTERALLHAGLDPEVSKIAGQFIIQYFPGLAFLTFFDAIRNFLVAIDETVVFTYFYFIAIPIVAIINYSLVITAGLGTRGLALGMAINDFLWLVFIFVYCCFTSSPKIRQAWSLPGAESFRDWGEIIALGAPGIVLYFIDWSCIYSLGILSGFLGVPEQATMQTVLIIQPLIFSPGYGMALTNTVWVGKSFGEGNVQKARTYSTASYMMMFAINLILAVCLFLTREDIGRYFSDDPEVLVLFPASITALSILLLVCSFELAGSGVLKSMGKQEDMAKFTFIFEFLIGVSSAVLLGIVYGLGNIGLWIGAIIGYGLYGVYILRFMNQQDWQAIADEAQARHEESETTIN